MYEEWEFREIIKVKMTRFIDLNLLENYQTAKKIEKLLIQIKNLTCWQRDINFKRDS